MKTCFYCGKPATGPYVATIFGRDSTLTVHSQCIPALSNQLAQALFDIRCEYPSGKPLKQWLCEQSEKEGVVPHAIYNRLIRAPDRHYPNVQITRINRRVVFVRERGAA